jgi:protein-disulfide isomerase
MNLERNRYKPYLIPFRIVVAFVMLASALFAWQTSDRQAEFYAGGAPDSPVKIEVFSDYQCPACRTFFLDTIRPILAGYSSSNKVSVVYRDFPLEMHPFARVASHFSIAAQRLGRDRWLRVSEALYLQQTQWSLDGDFEAVLSKVLNSTEWIRLKKLAADPAIDAAVQEEVMLGQSKGVNSTPTFFIFTGSGRQLQRVNGPIPYSVLKDYIDRLLKH